MLRNSWHIFTRNLMTKPNRARSRMLSTSVRRDVVHEVCSSSWERKPNWLAVGELVLRTAVCCAPQARAKAVSGKKSQPSDAD